MAKIILDALENETSILQKDPAIAAHEFRIMLHLVQEITKPDSKIKSRHIKKWKYILKIYYPLVYHWSFHTGGIKLQATLKDFP